MMTDQPTSGAKSTTRLWKRAKAWLTALVAFLKKPALWTVLIWTTTALGLLVSLWTLVPSEEPLFWTPVGFNSTPFLLFFGVWGSIFVMSNLYMVFSSRALWHRLLYYAAALTVFVASFSGFYYTWGNAVSGNIGKPRKSDYTGFGRPISKADAIYYTVGTLTTAGTGSLTAESQDIRKLATIQMPLGIGLIGAAVAGIVREGRERNRE